MVRRPLPPPPSANGASSLPSSKKGDLPPEPVYDEGSEPLPPPLAPRGARHLPPPPPDQRISADGEEYEAININSPPVAPQDIYDDFDSVGSGENPQETYDDFDVGATSRKPEPVPDDSDGELYDEMSDVPPPPRNLPGPPAKPAAQLPPIPIGRRPPAAPPSNDNSEVYDEWEEVGERGTATSGSESPEEYINPDDIEDGEVYQDPNEDMEQVIANHWSIPEAPSLPGELSKEGRLPISSVQDTYELDSVPDLPTVPVPTMPAPTVPPLLPPALPDRPIAPKKVTHLPKPDGFDPSQILKVKLKKTGESPGTNKNPTSQETDFRSVLRKTPGPEPNRTPVQALKPPVVKLKKVPSEEEKPPASEGLADTSSMTPVEPRPIKPLKPPANPPQEKTDNPLAAPRKVLVSPPPVNLKSHPPPMKPSMPKPPAVKFVAVSPPVQTAIVKPERHLSPPPAEEIKPVKDQDPLESYPWYHGMISRGQTKELLEKEGGDGVFLVRKSQKGSGAQPYTLVISYEGNIFNLKIRCRPEDQKIALGEEKTGEMAFGSVASLVSYHKDHNVILIGNPGGQTKLNKYPKRLSE